MHPQPDALHGRGHTGWVGQHVEKVAARHPQHVEFAPLGGLHHGRGGETLVVGHVKPPTLSQVGGVGRVHLDAAGQRRGVRTHLGATLHS